MCCLLSASLDFTLPLKNDYEVFMFYLSIMSIEYFNSLKNSTLAVENLVFNWGRCSLAENAFLTIVEIDYFDYFYPVFNSIDYLVSYQI